MAAGLDARGRENIRKNGPGRTDATEARRAPTSQPRASPAPSRELPSESNCKRSSDTRAVVRADAWPPRVGGTVEPRASLLEDSGTRAALPRACLLIDTDRIVRRYVLESARGSRIAPADVRNERSAPRICAHTHSRFVLSSWAASLSLTTYVCDARHFETNTGSSFTHTRRFAFWGREHIGQVCTAHVHRYG